jgi:uncharacterized protein (DUF433 family)
MGQSLIKRHKDYRYGKPHVRGHGVMVHVLKSMHKAGDSIELLANAYEISIEQVMAAINYCKRNKNG